MGEHGDHDATGDAPEVVRRVSRQLLHEQKPRPERGVAHRERRPLQRAREVRHNLGRELRQVRADEVDHDGERAQEPALRRGVPAAIVVITHDQPRKVRPDEVGDGGCFAGAIRDLRDEAQHAYQLRSAILQIGRLVGAGGSDEHAHELLLVVSHQHVEVDAGLHLQKLPGRVNRRRG